MKEKNPLVQISCVPYFMGNSSSWLILHLHYCYPLVLFMVFLSNYDASAKASQNLIPKQNAGALSSYRKHWCSPGVLWRPGQQEPRPFLKQSLPPVRAQDLHHPSLQAMSRKPSVVQQNWPSQGKHTVSGVRAESLLLVFRLIREIMQRSPAQALGPDTSISSTISTCVTTNVTAYTLCLSFYSSKMDLVIVLTAECMGWEWSAKAILIVKYCLKVCVSCTVYLGTRLLSPFSCSFPRIPWLSML